MYDNLLHSMFKAYLICFTHYYQNLILQASSAFHLHIMIPVLKPIRLDCPVQGLICIEKILKYAITEDYRTNQLQRQCKSINIQTGKPRKNVSIKTIIRTKAGPSFPLKRGARGNILEMIEGSLSKNIGPTLAMIRKQ